MRNNNLRETNHIKIIISVVSEVIIKAFCVYAKTITISCKRILKRRQGVRERECMEICRFFWFIGEAFLARSRFVRLLALLAPSHRRILPPRLRPISPKTMNAKNEPNRISLLFLLLSFTHFIAVQMKILGGNINVFWISVRRAPHSAQIIE